jgi:hypothetical protein
VPNLTKTLLLVGCIDWNVRMIVRKLALGLHLFTFASVPVLVMSGSKRSADLVTVFSLFLVPLAKSCSSSLTRTLPVHFSRQGVQ